MDTYQGRIRSATARFVIEEAVTFEVKHKSLSIVPNDKYGSRKITENVWFYSGRFIYKEQWNQRYGL